MGHRSNRLELTEWLFLSLPVDPGNSWCFDSAHLVLLDPQIAQKHLWCLLQTAVKMQEH